jgi:hypothetical protein
MVLRQLLGAAAGVLLFLGPSLAGGDEVRYVEQDGVLYRQTRRVVQRPVVETRMVDTARTVYREELTTEMRETARTWWTPVTEYRCESYIANRWNPLATPCVAFRMVPRTCWQCRTETVKVPVTCRRLVPVTETVRRPVTSCRMVPEEVTSRVVVRSPLPIATTVVAQPASPARYEAIGGVARLDRDPPRQGVSTAWRPATRY